MPEHTWSSEEVVRAVKRIEATLGEIRQEQRTTTNSLVPRESWDLAWGTVKEWRGMVGQEVVDLRADVGRLRTDVDDRFKAERTERVTAVRWALGVGIPTVVSVVGLVLSMI